jgi:hypothetical protein
MKIVNAAKLFLPALAKCWQYFVTWVVKGSELEVWQELDSYGRSFCWHAYDPKTGRSACFGSENEMRAWIEQCYYR